ncbi:MAG TPA: hypothetical protein VER12_05620 [Polyangiaceae bacterium]|nr:hypothetical protein [Polyangiaceae bacterium]
MATDSEPESGGVDEQQASVKKPPVASASDRPKKKKLKRPKPPIPKTEEEIDSPTKMTVGMLGVLGVMTVIMWAFARGACNYHPPKETRVPRVVTTEELAHDPKNAAIELQQRWLTRDFTGAAELATGDVAKQLEQEKAACNAACLAEKKSLSDKVLTSAVILDANMTGATARVTSIGLPGGPKVYLMRMERADSIWKATLRKADDGTPLPPLAASPHDAPAIQFSPAASAAASAPAASASAAPGALPHMIKLPVRAPVPPPASSK